jgi:spermidine synthase
VQPWIHLDRVNVPGGGELKLARRGDEFSIRLDTIELMNSRLSASEEALATLGYQKIADRKAPRILIGGLGMGFTLRALLAVARPQTKITVSELLPAVVEWARGPMSPLFGDSLNDPRVTIDVTDVAKIMRAGHQAWDAILLDVDNGPDGMTQSANDGLYSMAGLATARRALKPGGVLGVWSQGPDASFTKRMQRSQFEVEEVKVRAHRGKSGARHVLWFGMAGGPPRPAQSSHPRR